jgi:ketosteroid isomerase-like protein
MKYIVWILVLCSCAWAVDCPTGQSKTPGTLAQMEQSWARSLERSDVAALDCILAKEFEDAGPDGKLTDRAATLEKAGQHRTVRHELSDLRPHVQGDFGYIRGTAAAIDPSGKVVARVRFTDVYAYRDGRWQCVAGHESLISDEGH